MRRARQGREAAQLRRAAPPATRTLTLRHPHPPRALALPDFHPLVDSITYSDYYLLANDFVPYLEAQERVDATYRDQAAWTRMSILSTAGSGFFSSDRTIKEYAKDIWGVTPVQVPTPQPQ